MYIIPHLSSTCLKIWQSYAMSNLDSCRFQACRGQCLCVDSLESQLLGLALDAERGLLYYTDKIQGIIAEISTSGSNRREIFSDRRKHPRAIVVHSSSRWTKLQSCKNICACRASNNSHHAVSPSLSTTSISCKVIVILAILQHYRCIVEYLGESLSGCNYNL